MDKNSTRRHNFLKKDYERSGTKVIDKSLRRSAFDYSIAYEIISKREQEGWQLKSNSFGLAGHDDISDTQINQFFFTR